ncbi:MAG: pyridoxamine 5'-phosphate oxidase family protein [Planctomycetota bacterium]|jgi:uncharacterized protein YhbP (UPF0306 family)
MADGPANVRRFLDAHSTLTVACVDEEGPWAADVYFVRVGKDLCFFSSPDSRHARAYAEGSPAAGTVHGVYEGWTDIQGVQLSGRVEEIRGPAERARALAAHLVKFPFSRELLAEGRELIERVRFYRLRPERVFFVDNAKGFGAREEVEL